MSEPQIIKQLDPHEISALIKTREEVEAARAIFGLAAQPVKEWNSIPGPEQIPQVIKQLDPHETEARIKARKSAEAAKEITRLAALPVREYDPMPGPEAIPKVFDEKGREIPYLGIYGAADPKYKYPSEEPLCFEMGDPRAAIQSPHRMIVPPGDAELPPGYPGRLTWTPSGQ